MIPGGTGRGAVGHHAGVAFITRDMRGRPSPCGGVLRQGSPLGRQVPEAAESVEQRVDHGVGPLEPAPGELAFALEDRVAVALTSDRIVSTSGVAGAAARSLSMFTAVLPSSAAITWSSIHRTTRYMEPLDKWKVKIHSRTMYSRTHPPVRTLTGPPRDPPRRHTPRHELRDPIGEADADALRSAERKERGEDDHDRGGPDAEGGHVAGLPTL